MIQRRPGVRGDCAALTMAYRAETPSDITPGMNAGRVQERDRMRSTGKTRGGISWSIEWPPVAVKQWRDLWQALETEQERDAYQVKPNPWTGPGEYRMADLEDGTTVLRRVNRGRRGESVPA